MTYNVSMGTLNPTIPYHTNTLLFNVCQSYCARYSYRLDVCPSVCPSVTRWYCVETAQPIVKLICPFFLYSHFNTADEGTCSFAVILMLVL